MVTPVMVHNYEFWQATAVPSETRLLVGDAAFVGKKVYALGVKQRFLGGTSGKVGHQKRVTWGYPDNSVWVKEGHNAKNMLQRILIGVK